MIHAGRVRRIFAEHDLPVHRHALTRAGWVLEGRNFRATVPDASTDSHVHAIALEIRRLLVRAERVSEEKRAERDARAEEEERRAIAASTSDDFGGLVSAISEAASSVVDLFSGDSGGGGGSGYDGGGGDSGGGGSSGEW